MVLRRSDDCADLRGSAQSWSCFTAAMATQSLARAATVHWTAFEAAYKAWECLAQTLERTLRMTIGESHFQILLSELQDQSVREAIMRRAWIRNEADQTLFFKLHEARASNLSSAIRAVTPSTNPSWTSLVRDPEGHSVTRSVPETFRSSGTGDTARNRGRKPHQSEFGNRGRMERSTRRSIGSSAQTTLGAMAWSCGMTEGP